MPNLDASSREVSSPKLAVLPLTLLFVACAARVESAPPAAPPSTGTPRVLQTDDNWQIYITYFPAPGDRPELTKEAPVVVLLHGDKQGENRLVYEGPNGLAARLQAEGCAVITVDLRKHGQSTEVGTSPSGGRSESAISGTDYQNMVDYDMEAVKKFIEQQHQAKKLNMRKMAIVGAGSSVGVAAAYAVADWNKEPYDDAPSDDMKTPRGQDVRALVFLSPPARVKGLNLAQKVSEIRNPDWNIAFLTMYGKANRPDSREAEALHKRLSGTNKASKDRMYLIGINVPSRGTDLLGIKEVGAETGIVNFIKRHLFNLRDSEWRDRQSRLVRK
ncbi:MAG TPA: alpha/beta fold hydrolase [Planctomycetaceae bacterium]|nr:alpha/beta fold hydrolase [Planctomycetaceae bacterium]